ncbi:MAG: 1-acyl-sn-glycerol-3-phosphate acyltransferase [Clostridia bacterium]|nr:1-acyl-sn-glycerol-3-phosphate acyltransferase [Clostridia bacterium]
MPYNYDFTNFKSRPLYSVVRPLAGLITKTKYKINYVGVENLPEGGGFILAANHITALDPVIVSVGCDKTMHFMAKYELFQNKLIGWAMTQLNAFPVDRTKFDEDAINYAVTLVRNGGILGIFPEGTRSPDYTPQKGKGGVCYIAKVCKCDVVPVSIYTCDEAKTGTRLTVRYGKPIKHEDLKFDPNSTKMKDLRHATNLIMEKITELWSMEHGD